MIKRGILFFILAVFSVAGLSADILELKDGTILDGTYMGGTTGTLRFQSKGNMEVFPITSVMALTISRTTKQSPGSQAQPSQSTVVVAPQAAPSAPSPSAGPLVVPAGMQFKIKC